MMARGPKWQGHARERETEGYGAKPTVFQPIAAIRNALTSSLTAMRTFTTHSSESCGYEAAQRKTKPDVADPAAFPFRSERWRLWEMAE